MQLSSMKLLVSLNKTLIRYLTKSTKKAINNLIPHPLLLVIDATGKNLGNLSLKQAMEQFNINTHDLILVNEQSKPPVAKIQPKLIAHSTSATEATSPPSSSLNVNIHIKKDHYQQPTKSKPTKSKELSINSNISNHDLQIKLNQMIDFLVKGVQVYFNITLIRKTGDILESDISRIIIEKSLEVGTLASQRIEHKKTIKLIFIPKNKKK